MWAGRRPAHILIKPLPKLFFGGPKIGKKLQGEGKGSVLKSRPRPPKNQKPHHAIWDFWNLKPYSKPATFNALFNFWSGVGALFWGLGLPKGWWLNPPPGPLGLVGGLVGLFVGCWSNIEHRLAHINQTLVICCWSDLAPLWAIDQMLAIYRPKLNYI